MLYIRAIHCFPLLLLYDTLHTAEHSCTVHSTSAKSLTLTNMQLILLRLRHVLLITTILYFTEEVITGCEDWRLQGIDEVCCEKCSSGHRLLQHCGRDPTKLCTPCKPNTFTTDPLAFFCKRCNLCIDPQVQLQPCSASADTVCGCKPGFRCGSQDCSYCAQECSKGQEPTDELTCRKCPEGTFNNEIHSACKPWRKSCPEGEHMIAGGNEFSDIKCSRKPETITSFPNALTVGPTARQITEITTPTTTEKTERRNDNAVFTVIMIFAVTAAFMIIFIVLLWLANKMRTNMSKDLKPDSQSPELTIMVVEHEEACSFHQPEQEQGSSESINTQGSETKLIV